VFPISVTVAALVVRRRGPTPFFLIAAVTLAVAIAAGLSQRAWREFGANHSTPTPEPAHHLEGQPA
jgi:protein-S-isoprenylcysteine O-methyltransferase Ste14